MSIAWLMTVRVVFVGPAYERVDSFGIESGDSGVPEHTCWVVDVGKEHPIRGKGSSAYGEGGEAWWGKPGSGASAC